VEDGVKPNLSDTADGEISRRDFVRGAAATGLVVVGGGYVKPALKLAGVTRLASATSTPPPPITSGAHGCTPGFWGNNGATGAAGGVAWWNTASDPQWTSNGGAGSNPFTHTTLFNSFFAPHARLAGVTMWDLVNGSGGPDPARQAGRQLIAAYLNASFGAYTFSTTQLRTMWSGAVAGGDPALRALATLLDDTNTRCDAA